MRAIAKVVKIENINMVISIGINSRTLIRMTPRMILTPTQLMILIRMMSQILSNSRDKTKMIKMIRMIRMIRMIKMIRMIRMMREEISV